MNLLLKKLTIFIKLKNAFDGCVILGYSKQSF